MRTIARTADRPDPFRQHGLNLVPLRSLLPFASTSVGETEPLVALLQYAADSGAFQVMQVALFGSCISDLHLRPVGCQSNVIVMRDLSSAVRALCSAQRGVMGSSGAR